MQQGPSPRRRTAGFVQPAARWTPSPSRRVRCQIGGHHAILLSLQRRPMARRKAAAIRRVARPPPRSRPHPEIPSPLQRRAGRTGRPPPPPFTPQPALVQRSYEAWVAAAVAERAPCRTDAGAQRRLRDDAALPNHVDQLVLADDPIAVANEVNEQIEYLRLDMNDRPGAPQLLPRDV